jgi:hypothetical protein
VELKPEDLDDWRVLSEKERERQNEKASQKGEPLVTPREVPIEEDKDFSLIIYFTEPQIPAADIHIAANKQEQAMSGHYEGVLTNMFEAKVRQKFSPALTLCDPEISFHLISSRLIISFISLSRRKP